MTISFATPEVLLPFFQDASKAVKMPFMPNFETWAQRFHGFTASRPAADPAYLTVLYR